MRKIVQHFNKNTLLLIAVIIILTAGCIKTQASEYANKQLESEQIKSIALSHESTKIAPLTFEERIACKAKIERVFWKLRIWENPAPKPPFEEMMPTEILIAKVEDEGRKTNFLEHYWHHPITGEQLQQELNRIARNTKKPGQLLDLFIALGNDPHVIAECLVRPILLERFANNWYANDERIEANDIHQKKKSFDEWWKEQKQFYEISFNEPVYSYELRQISDDICELPEWEPMQGPPDPRWDHTAIWTGTEMIIWGGFAADGYYAFYNNGAAYNPSTDTWRHISSINAPEGRTFHTAVWSGTEMIIWGGWGTSGSYLHSGGTYNPQTDTWQTTSIDSAPSSRLWHTAVWSGTEMIIWGGNTGDSSGGRYNPLTNTWSETSLIDAPSPRSNHTAVWTGSEMIIWGGASDSSGGKYNPVTNTWIATSLIDAPSPKSFHTAVWTGSEMIVWGGMLGDESGGKYNPATNTWNPTSLIDAPAARWDHTAVWTGSAMIIWGGRNDTTGPLDSGAIYDPDTDSWKSVAQANAPQMRYNHTAVWIGTEMIIWGGEFYDHLTLNTGARYNPSTNSWIPLNYYNTPEVRASHTAVWTGVEMIVWGGYNKNGLFPGIIPLDTGGKYVAAVDAWFCMTVSGSPDARTYHTAVWTGTEMIIWGGEGPSGILNTGGRYNPAADNWSPTQTYSAPSARSFHSAIWTGNEMIVWGGGDWGTQSNTGGRYNPISDSWSPTPTDNAPSARFQHTAIWSGSEMIIWGGEGPSGILNTGGRYNPNSDTWSPTKFDFEPWARKWHTAVWTGSEMIIWGGSGGENRGGRYNPNSDTWELTSLDNAPSPRFMHSAVWTGEKMIIWGGDGNLSGILNTGAYYDPVSDSWITLPIENAPYIRYAHTGVWTGEKMIILGGEVQGLYFPSWYRNYLNSGGLFCKIYAKLQPYLLAKPQVDDSASPTANGIIETDEPVILLGHVENIGNKDSENTGGFLDTLDPIDITQPDSLYGLVPAGGDKICSLCYSLVAPSANKHSTHWDFQVTETLTSLDYGPVSFDYNYHVGNSFSDVLPSNIFYPFIETILHAGITSGCSDSDFCPYQSVLREQMAKFVCIAMDIVSPGSCTATACNGIFYDVPQSNIFCPHIEGLFNAGVINGCLDYPFSYCPAIEVQRQAMAKFICLGMNAAQGGTCVTSPCEGIFNDVPPANPFCSHIEALYKAGVISGCAPSLYCPAENVNRQQMAKFIVNAFGFTL